MHIGGRGFHGVDQSAVAVHPEMHFHTVGRAFRAAVIPNVAFLGLVHLRIPIPSFVFGRAWCRDDGDIDDRALLHDHAVGFEVRLHGCENLLTQIVLLQQMPERKYRGLVREPVGDQSNAGKALDRRHLDQRILHRWIAEDVPLLQQMDPQQPLRGSQGLPSPTGREAGHHCYCLGVVGLNQIEQRLPRHNWLHLREKSLSLGAVFGSRLLVITVGEALRAALTELLAAHVPSPRLRLNGYFRAADHGFPESHETIILERLDG
jgi:hypothetical protein